MLRFLSLATIAAIFLSACASKPITVREVETVEVVRYETVPVPELLLRACKVSLAALESNSDLEEALAAALIELRRCTDDKEAIRELR